MGRARQSFARPFQAMMRALLAIVVVAALAPLAPAAEQIKVDVAFSGLWWGYDQLEGMDMRNPPPMTTRATIKEWDAGDNQWPPHPDTVDVDVTVAAGGSLKEPVEVSYQYEAKGRLTAPKTIVRSVIDLAPGATQVLHGSINVMGYISHLNRPKFVRVTTRIGKRPAVTAELPFVLGD
jgi:hypothetical protein